MAKKQRRVGWGWWLAGLAAAAFVLRIGYLVFGSPEGALPDAQGMFTGILCALFGLGLPFLMLAAILYPLFIRNASGTSEESRSTEKRTNESSQRAP
ncbi:hypothetical protein GCM10027188_29540 [Lysobacter humi (ex Lee et al. 2017)]